MTAIYSDINAKIQAILDGVSSISVSYAYPAIQIDSYPAAIYYPTSLENTFETTIDNFKIYGYKLWITVNTEGTTIEEVFSTIMPEVMDEVLKAFDDGWNFTELDGHRVWCKIDTGLWSVSEENSGIEVTSELRLSIKMLTS